MTAKEYLNQAYEINKKIDLQLKKTASLRSSLYGRGANTSGYGNFHASDNLGKAIAKVIDYEKQADKLIDELVSQKIEIEKTISLVADERERQILESRYLLFKSWKVIADSSGYSLQHVFRIHSAGLQQVEKILQNSKDESKCD